MQTLACSGVLWFSKKTRLFLFFVFLRSLQILYWESNFAYLSVFFKLFQTTHAGKENVNLFILCFLPVRTLHTKKCFSITALGWIFGLYLQSLTLIFPMIWCVFKILIYFCLFLGLLQHIAKSKRCDLWCIFWQCQSSQSFEPWGLSLTPV